MSGYSEDALATAAHLYYTEGLKQEAVAGRMNISRLAVTRMLKKARDQGIVQISVNRPLPALVGLAIGLEKKYGLKSVRVVQTGAAQEETVAAIGRAGAEFLSSLLRPGCRIGVAWSRTVSSILPYVRRTSKSGVCINELAGTYLAPNIPYGVSMALAEKLHVPLESIPMPVLALHEHARDIMLKEHMIRKALANAARVDIALVGLGKVSESSSMVDAGYVAKAHLKEFEMKGVVGELLLRCYDAHGQYIRMSFEKRTISLTWERIKSLPFVAAMAFGAEKLDAIRGALDGHVIHGLVTDKNTAAALLE